MDENENFTAGYEMEESKFEELRLEYAVEELMKRPMFDRVIILNQVIIYILNGLENYLADKSNGQLPSVYGICRLLSLIDSIGF